MKHKSLIVDVINNKKLSFHEPAFISQLHARRTEYMAISSIVVVVEGLTGKKALFC